MDETRDLARAVGASKLASQAGENAADPSLKVPCYELEGGQVLVKVG